MLKRFKCGTCMKGTVLNIERELGRWSKSSRGFCCLLSSSVSQGRKFDVFSGFLDPLPLSPSVNLHLNLRCKLSTTILQPLSKLLLFLPSRLTLSSCTSWPSVKHTWVVLSHCKVIKRWAKQQGCSACSHVWLVSTRLLWLLTITSCPLIPWEERGRKGGIRNLEGLTDHWVRDTIQLWLSNKLKTGESDRLERESALVTAASTSNGDFGLGWTLGLQFWMYSHDDFNFWLSRKITINLSFPLLQVTTLWPFSSDSLYGCSPISSSLMPTLISRLLIRKSIKQSLQDFFSPKSKGSEEATSCLKSGVLH